MNGLAITLNATHKVEVVFNGLEIMTKLNDSIRSLVIAETNKAITHMLDVKFGLPPVDK
jgi:hypothetical protein